MLLVLSYNDEITVFYILKHRYLLTRYVDVNVSFLLLYNYVSNVQSVNR